MLDDKITEEPDRRQARQGDDGEPPQHLVAVGRPQERAHKPVMGDVRMRDGSAVEHS
jgi:hypothetical protein